MKTVSDRLAEVIDELAQAKRGLSWNESFTKPFLMLQELAKHFADEMPTEAPRVDRIVSNLRVGLIHLRSDAAMLYGYANGAIAELTWLRGEVLTAEEARWA